MSDGKERELKRLAILQSLETGEATPEDLLESDDPEVKELAYEIVNITIAGIADTLQTMAGGLRRLAIAVGKLDPSSLITEDPDFQVKEVSISTEEAPGRPEVAPFVDSRVNVQDEDPDPSGIVFRKSPVRKAPRIKRPDPTTPEELAELEAELEDNYLETEDE